MVHTNSIHIPINAAIKSKVCRLRINPVIRCIVHRHYKYVVVFQKISDISSPGGISAVMLRHLLSIGIKGGTGVGSTEFQIDLLPFRQVRPAYFFSVITGATVVIISTVLSICRIPCVRQSNGFQICRLPVFQKTFFGKRPTVIQEFTISHSLSPLDSCDSASVTCSWRSAKTRAFSSTFSLVNGYSQIKKIRLRPNEMAGSKQVAL